MFVVCWCCLLFVACCLLLVVCRGWFVVCCSLHGALDCCLLFGGWYFVCGR